MKKILILILIIATIIPTATSCGKEDMLYYGVVEYSVEANGVFVNIPEIGLCEIPSAKVITTENSVASRAEVKKGDVIRLNFGKVDGVEIMECYPARFASECEEISVVAEGVSIVYPEYNRSVIELTQPISQSLSGARTDDLVAFYIGEGEEIEDAYCYGTVLPSRQGEITMRIELLYGVGDFLSKYPSEFNQKIVDLR